MNQNIKISVVMPVYNSENFLNEAIISVLSQTYNNFEFIIINDGSTDSSKRIIEEYKNFDNRIKLINQNNKGYSAALNTGLKLCTGEYIARMDSDDICLPNRFYFQVNFLNNNKNIDLVGGGVNIIDSEGKHSAKRYFPNSQRIIESTIDSETPLVHPTAMFRKNLIQKVGFYRENFEPAEDYDLWLRCYDKKMQISNIKKIIINYRVHSKSVSRTRTEQQFIKSLIAKKLSLMRRSNLTDFIDESTAIDKNLFEILPDKFKPTEMELIWLKIYDINNLTIDELKRFFLKIIKIKNLNNDDKRIKIIIFFRMIKIFFMKKNYTITINILINLFFKHPLILFKTIAFRYI